ncbi:MAG: thioredoxin-disulfide reductase [Candidatus Nealsonbacteria bacterium CG02_land_8_20_14_3_00_37_10]|uniref:Thioredoxin-disulfide reductase n=1 Tax=Candidatus Nealsonbacteria bacterium CG02_land_8_20_14_3_00_37_10 TaxID=1974699 RepID=A0A2M7D9Y8_9BACT|nr:MAG: thioredoxin-disulfide reductase [Candidatus Nealsonbacteria bacterium CG02_land_8_20_14_3_00_37_10]
MVYDLIIIGGGPAGTTAGIYAARQKLDTLLITKSFGGQIARKAVGIENYPGFEEISGLDLIKKFEKQLRKFTRQSFPKENLGGQVDIERDGVGSIKKIGRNFLVSTKTKHQFQSRAVIIASGADPRPLEIPGEKKFIGRGVSYCSVCDGPLFSNKEVAVVGGGNAGFEAAIFLANWVKKIYILESGSEIRADKDNQEKAQKTGKVEAITGITLKKIKGKNFVSFIVFEDKKSKSLKKLAVEGIFVEIGSQPATSFVKGLVDFNKKDEILVDPQTSQTKTPGLFAAGDVDDVPYKQIVIAAGEGAKAALSVSNYLQKNGRN